MTTNETLAKDWVKQIVDSNVNDARSSIAARVLLGGREMFGGGNFQIAQGMLGAINFLQKVYVLLEGKDKRNSHNQIKEKEAFKTLVTYLPDYIKLGLVASDAVDAWESYRISLAHMGRPKEMAMVFGIAIHPGSFPDISDSSQLRDVMARVVRDLFRKDDPTFTKAPNGAFTCNVDLLARDVEKIGEWLICRILAAPETSARECLDWVEKAFTVTRQRNVTAKAKIVDKPKPSK